MPETSRELDVIVYGATGFVGKLTAQYLSRPGGGARIGLAGRSAERVRAVRGALGPAAQDWPILAADAEQPATLEAMAARTRVVITTVGPYTRYGMPLVAACAAAGTDYVDLTGEANRSREHRPAPQTGRRHPGSHRARLRLRLHPVGSERLCALPCRPRRGRR